MHSYTTKENNDIVKRFQSVDISEKYGEDAVIISNHLRMKLGHIAEYINGMLVDSRETALCLTKLEEAMFYGNASIARHGIKKSDE